MPRENRKQRKGKVIKIDINGYADGIKGRYNALFIKFSESRISFVVTACKVQHI